MPLHIARPRRLKYVGSDIAASYSETATETVIGQVTIPANTVKTEVIAFASLLSYNASADTQFYNFRIRCGTTGTASDTEYAQQLSKTKSIAGGLPTDMGGIIAYITGPDWTVQNYVSVTVTMDVTSTNVRGYCLSFVVIGK